MPHVPRRAVVVAGAAIAAAGVLAPPAVAHITVNPREATKGSFAKLTFRVPNERDNAGTTTVEVAFPSDHPIANVSVRSQPGWTYVVEKGAPAKPLAASGEPVTEVVTRITWEGGPIRPGEFAEFDVSAGPLPEDADQLVFKALQTYEGGEIVRWIEEHSPGGEEPEHPAPVLTLTNGDEDRVSSEPANTDGDASSVEDIASQSDVDEASRLGVIGIVVGALGLLVAILALGRRRSELRTNPVAGANER